MDDDEGNCDIPTEGDLRFIDDDDLISSDDTVNEDCTPNKPKKYNQLHPKANFVYKLLKSAKPKVGSIWKKVITPSSVDLLSSSDLNCDLFVASSDMMKKSSKKRKHEEVSKDEGSYHQKKKHVIINTNDQSYENVGHKRDDHNMSSSDNEDCDASSSKSSQNHKEIDNTNNYNGYMSSCGNDSLSKRGSSVNVKTLNKDLETNLGEGEANVIESSDCEREISQDSDNNGIEHTKWNREIQDNSVLHSRSPLQTKDTSKTNEKLYHKRCFTQEDEEDISEFSCLLSEKLKEKNNIWIMQCPINMNCTKIVNQYLNLSEGCDGCQLVDGDRSYEAYSYKNNQSRPVTLAVPSQQNHFQLCTIPISGNIIVEESVSVENNISHIPETFQAVKMPENLRTRHPLLGLDYEKQPRTVVRNERVSKKKKKKGSKTDDIDTDGVSESEVNYSNGEYSKKNKKKKHRNKEDLTNAGIQDQLLDQSNEESKVKKKRKKKHMNDKSSL